MKKLFIYILLALFLFGCSSSNNDNKESVEPTTTSESDALETSIPSQTETSEEAYVVYEGIFLDNDEMLKLFEETRGEAPLDNVTKEFHLTTEFMPESDHKQWYGEKVNVHIISYKIQDVEMDEVGMTTNEGFKAEVTAENEELNTYLASLDKNYHITGAYKDAPKYTNYIDFSDGEAMDIYVSGTFGGFYSDNSYRFESNE